MQPWKARQVTQHLPPGSAPRWPGDAFGKSQSVASRFPLLPWFW
jgi:hypothetical protein